MIEQIKQSCYDKGTKKQSDWKENQHTNHNFSSIKEEYYEEKINFNAFTAGMLVSLVAGCGSKAENTWCIWG